MMIPFPYETREIYTIIPQGLTHHNHLNINNVVINSSSTSDEADEIKKQRRMMSNRESARRSRMKKKRYMEELTLLVMRLRTEKHELVQRLKHVTESHDRVVEENAKLREEASHLSQIMAENSFICNCLEC